MAEGIGPALVRGDEPVALGLVEPLHGSCRHSLFLQRGLQRRGNTPAVLGVPATDCVREAKRNCPQSPDKDTSAGSMNPAAPEHKGGAAPPRIRPMRLSTCQAHLSGASGGWPDRLDPREKVANCDRVNLRLTTASRHSFEKRECVQARGSAGAMKFSSSTIRCFVCVVAVLSVLTVWADIAHAQSAEDIQKQIDEAREELRAVEAARELLTDQILGLQQQRDFLREDLAAVENFKRLPERMISTANSLIRQSERLIAKALSPVEKFKAIKAYRESQESVEDFKKLFRTFRGQEPDRTTLSQYDLHATILELEARKLLVSDMAEPLAIAGKSIVKVVDIIRTGQALANFAGNSISRKMLVKGTKTGLKLKSVAQVSFDLADVAKRSADRIRQSKQAFGVESADMSRLLDKVGGVHPDNLLQRVNDATDILDENVSDEDVRLAIDMAAADPTFEDKIRQIDEAQQTFNQIAANLSGRVKVGRQGLIENLGQSEIVRQATDPVIKAAQDILQSMQRIKIKVDAEADRVTDALNPVLEALEANERALAALTAEANAIDDRINDLRQQLFVAQIREQKIEDVSSPVVTGISIGLQGPRQISSNRFGELAGFRNHTALNISVSLGTLESRECRHSCRRNDQGRLICQNARRNVFVRRGSFQLDTNRMNRFGVSIRTEGVVQFDNDRGAPILRGARNGSGIAHAQVNGATEIRQVDHVCGSEDQVVRGRLEATSPGIGVVSVDPEKIDINGLTSRQGSRGRLDFFGEAFGNLRVRIPVILESGREVMRNIVGGVQVETRGDTFIADMSAQGGEITVFAKDELFGAMDVVLKSVIKPGGTSQVDLGRFIISNTGFTEESEFPDGPWVLDGDDFLPPGETARFRIVKDGGADPSDLQVEWRVSGVRRDQLVLRQDGTFQGDNANLAMAFDTQKVIDPGRSELHRFDNRDISVRAEIRYRGRTVKQLAFSGVRLAQPILERVQIGLRGEGESFVPVARQDFITPTVDARSRLARISIRGQLKGGVDAFLPLNDFEQILSGGDGVIDRNGEINLEPLGTANGEISKASVIFISAKYQAFVGSAQGRTFYVVDGEKEDQFGLSVNKLLLELVDEQGPDIVRARVVGPGNFAGFNAVFQRGGEEVAVPLVPDGDDEIADLETARNSVTQVEIRNQGGQRDRQAGHRHSRPAPRPPQDRSGSSGDREAGTGGRRQRADPEHREQGHRGQRHPLQLGDGPRCRGLRCGGNAA
ncbi:MAG: hypothetical protein ACMVY4_19160 [Minwuia sp.]|uniref:hypothetical protein n=1 Tax=Minwuia sp. TaxID=2493630 RepID=UPI003A8AD583